MPRKNANTDAKPKLRKISGKGKPKPKAKLTSRPGAKRPNTPADEPPDVEAVVSRIAMIRHTGRGGRGR